MSKERAIKFCNLCQEYSEGFKIDGTWELRMLRDYATSQAMQALERMEGISPAILTNCQECDYKKALIAYHLGKG